MPSPPTSPRPWPEHGGRPGPDLFVARVRFDDFENPRTGAVLTRTVLTTPDWVNVVARDREGRFVLVRQFRFGTRSVTTEIPGGVIDPGEDHRAAAERELREETGYTASNWRYLGCVEANPAYQNNLCHHWLAEDAERTHELALDPGEDIVVATLSEAELRGAIEAGDVRHSLVLCALARVLDLRGSGPGAPSADPEG